MKESLLRTMVKYIGAGLWSLFLSGLFTLLPLALTLAIFSLAFRILKEWLEPLQHILPQAIADIPHSEIILGIFFVLLIGAILRFFILRTIVHALEETIVQIPLIRPIYSGIKQLVQAFSPQDNVSFKNVVLIEFPRKGAYSIGLVTSQAPATLSPDTSKKFICVFVPTTPNPTTGFFMMVPETDVQAIDLTRQEAMALIISGGIIQPQRFENQNSI